MFISIQLFPPAPRPLEIKITRRATTPKHLLFSRFWVTIGWHSYQQQPDRTPVCQAFLTTTTSSEYSNSTIVGFEPVRRHFVALQTPAAVSAPFLFRDTVTPVRRPPRLASTPLTPMENIAWYSTCIVSNITVINKQHLYQYPLSEGVPGWFRCCMPGSRPSATKIKVLQSYSACFKCILQTYTYHKCRILKDNSLGSSDAPRVVRAKWASATISTIFRHFLVLPPLFASSAETTVIL